MYFFHTSSYNLNYKNKKKFALYKILAILLVFFCFAMPTGCKSKFSKLLSYSVETIPKNLDPQTAYHPDEISIINNIFTGIYKRNFDGTFSLAAASSVETNDDKTRYVFSIRNNTLWNLNSNQKDINEKFSRPVRCADFEFAFKRLLNPVTKSPFAQNYYFIKNAQKVHEGALDISALGVYVDSGKLVLELEHPIANLEELLSMSPTMPCNEEFFHYTKGRYGLTINTILCNGIFYIHQWLQDQKNKKLRLRVNDKSPLSSNVKIIGVNISQRPQKEAATLIKKNEIDSAFFDSDSININSLTENNKILPFQNSTSGIIFNQNNVMFNNDKIKKALALSIKRDELTNVLDANKMTIAKNLLPNSINIAGQSFRELTGQQNSSPVYNPQAAKELFTAGLNEIQPKEEPKKKDNKKNKKKENNRINSNSFSIMVTENYYNIINTILQNWQKDLNLYLKIKVCDNETYLKNLRSGNFDCAIVNIDNDFDSPLCMLSKFLPDSPFNYANTTLTDLKPTIDAAVSCGSLQDAVQTFLHAEQIILQSGNFIPICHPIENFAHNKKFKDIYLIPSCKQLYFEFVKPSQ